MKTRSLPPHVYILGLISSKSLHFK